jgi:hypothetical protein
MGLSSWVGARILTEKSMQAKCQPSDVLWPHGGRRHSMILEYALLSLCRSWRQSLKQPQPLSAERLVEQ